MIITVQYFGQIAEALKKNSEKIEINNGSTINDFSKLILSVHPKLQEFVFKIAVNHEITENNDPIFENDTIAVLPPFAGG